jgi:hypothetical protein
VHLLDKREFQRLSSPPREIANHGKVVATVEPYASVGTMTDFIATEEAPQVTPIDGTIPTRAMPLRVWTKSSAGVDARVLRFA